MRHFILSFAFVAGAFACAPAYAQDNTVLSCKDLTIPITGLPKETALSFTLTPDELLKQCTSTTGAKLSVIDPVNGIPIAPAPGSNQTIPFTVKDDKGNTATANVLITRS